MRGLLNLSVDSEIELKEIDDIDNHPFICEDIESYINQFNYPSYRYYLRSLITYDTYILDVQKCYNQDIKLLCIKEEERLEYDQNFLSLVGTSPLGYNHKELQHIDFILYNIVSNPMSSFETIKYIVDKDELPSNPEEKGYLKDGNNNWYFLAKKDDGAIIKFENAYKRVWEYKQDEDQRLIIETKALKSEWEYIKIRPDISIYIGKRLHRRDIRLKKATNVTSGIVEHI